MAPTNKSQHPVPIDANFRCDATSELHSATSCGFQNACDPIINTDGTITTCSSISGKATRNVFQMNESKNKARIFHNQTNSAFMKGEITSTNKLETQGRYDVHEIEFSRHFLTSHAIETVD